jgi:hypothetical protein
MKNLCNIRLKLILRCYEILTCPVHIIVETWHAASLAIQSPARHCELANNPESVDLSIILDCSQAHNDEREGLISVDIFIS